METELPVNDIVTAVGYENNSYFYRKFRERYQMTPNAYRERYRGERPGAGVRDPHPDIYGNVYKNAVVTMKHRYDSIFSACVRRFELPTFDP